MVCNNARKIFVGSFLTGGVIVTLLYTCGQMGATVLTPPARDGPDNETVLSLLQSSPIPVNQALQSVWNGCNSYCNSYFLFSLVKSRG